MAQLVGRDIWDFISAYPLCFSQSAETLDTLRKARFSYSRKIPAKVVHTTCLLLQNRISYLSPGVAQLVARVVWVCRGGIRNRARRNAAKPCSTCVCGTFHDCRKRHKSSFDHRNDHRQKNLYFYRSPWYHGRKVNIRVWLNW